MDSIVFHNAATAPADGQVLPLGNKAESLTVQLECAVTNTVRSLKIKGRLKGATKYVDIWMLPLSGSSVAPITSITSEGTYTATVSAYEEVYCPLETITGAGVTLRGFLSLK